MNFVHASLLPRYRGAAPIHWSIINGEAKTGVTTMGAKDYQCLCARRFLDELYIAAEKLVIRENCFMDGQLHITLEKDEKLSQGICEASSCYEEEPAPEADKAEPHTIVLDRSEFAPPLNLPAQHKTASLTVVEGDDLDSYLEIGERQVYIGRRESNEFILTDTNASRLHDAGWPYQGG